MSMNRWLARVSGQTERMRFPPRPALLSLLTAAVVAVLVVSAVAPVGSGTAAPAAVPPLVLPAQVGQTASRPESLQAVRRRFDCIERVNLERAQRGIAPVTYDARIARAAAGHSAYQAAIRTMGHVGPGKANGGTRMRAAGYGWTVWGENVAAGQSDCATVMSAWMASSTHRANILDVNFVHIGVGMALGVNGVWYWTMDLGRGG